MNPLNDTEVNALGAAGIREGDSLPRLGRLLPDGTFSSPSVITSAPAATQTTTNMKTLDQLMADARQLSSRAQSEIDRGTQITPGNTRQVSPRMQASLAKQGMSVLDTALGAMSGQQSPASTELRASYDKTISEIDALSSRMDAQSAVLMDSIRREYDSLIREQEALNKSYEQGVTQEGMVSGRARYAPVIQAGIVTSAVQSGLGKIADLQAKKAKLLVEAQNARDERQYKELNEKLKAYRDLVKEEREQAQTLYQNTLNASREAREQLKFEQTQEENTAKSLAASIATALTGNPDQDAQLISTLAKDYNIRPFVLQGALDDYNRSVTKDLPSIIQEYEYMVRNGLFNGTPIEYMSYKNRATRASGSPSSRVLSTRDAIAIGMPNLAGVAEDELRLSMIDSRGRVVENPPAWFIDALTQSENIPATLISPAYIKERWNEVRNDPDVTKFLTGSSPSNAESLLLGSLGVQPTSTEDIARSAVVE